jgi:hypothetical protein
MLSINLLRKGGDTMKTKLSLLFLLFAAITFIVAPAAYAIHPNCALGTVGDINGDGVEDLADQIECSIQEGLAQITGIQQGNGSWPDGYSTTAATGLICVKLVDRAKELGLNPFDQAEYQYANNLIDAINHIASRIVPGDAGELKTNESQTTYTTGIAAMCFSSAAEVDPSRTATTHAGAKTYQQIVVELSNWLTGNQQTGGCAEGGWYYREKEIDSRWADNSIAGYATMGLGFTQSLAGVTIPAANINHLNAFINHVQQTGGLYDGGSNYGGRWGGTPPSCSPPHTLTNTLKTGNLLYELCLTGEGEGASRVDRAITFLETYWNNVAGQYNGGGWIGNYQSIFTMMKGLEGCGIDLLDLDGGGNKDDDWFNVVAQYIVDNQRSDGTWMQTHDRGNIPLNAGWALLTLEKAVPEITKRVDVDIKPGSCPNPLNTRSQGKLPVAILGTEDFDVTTIDTTTVEIGLAGDENGAKVSPIQSNIEDVGTPFQGELCDCHDLNGDGILDLTLKFSTQELVTTLGLNSLDMRMVPFVVTGNLSEDNGSTPLTGEDCIRLIKRKVKVRAKKLRR